MNTCHDDLVQLYVEGELAPVERAIVADHLRACDHCRRLATFYKGLNWDLAHDQDLLPEPPSFDDDALAAALAAEWKRVQPQNSGGGRGLSTLWLTSNPALTGPVRLVGRLFGRREAR